MRDVDAPGFWEERYRGHEDGWDTGAPTPAFERLVAGGGTPPRGIRAGGKTHLFPPRADGRAPRILVPGCGRGHDALHLAARGFDVTAVDFSPFAVAHVRTEAARRGLAIAALRADIFDLDGTIDGAYDGVLEYTCYCAIAPERRGEYAATVARALRPGGLFFGILYPLDGRPGGPPFAVDPAEFRALMAPRFLALYEAPPEISVERRRGSEALVVWRRRAAE